MRPRIIRIWNTNKTAKSQSRKDSDAYLPKKTLRRGTSNDEEKAEELPAVIASTANKDMAADTDIDIQNEEEGKEQVVVKSGDWVGLVRLTPTHTIKV